MIFVYDCCFILVYKVRLRYKYKVFTGIMRYWHAYF